MICVQETCLKLTMECITQGYVVVLSERCRGRWGCSTFVIQGLSYRMLGRGIEQEYVVVEVCLRGGVIVVVNYYNPCQILDLEVLGRVEGPGYM